MSPQIFFLFLFPFLIINISTWQVIESVRHPNFVGVSSIPFLCQCALVLLKKKMQRACFLQKIKSLFFLMLI